MQQNSTNSDTQAGPYAGFFYQGDSKAYMPNKVPNIQRIINNDILKIVNIVFSGGGSCPPAPAVYGPGIIYYHEF